MKKLFPKVQLSYEEGVYTIEILFDDKATIITDGKNIDELMSNIDDALECHFQEKEAFDVNIKIPIINFNRYKRLDAAHI